MIYGRTRRVESKRGGRRALRNQTVICDDVRVEKSQGKRPGTVVFGHRRRRGAENARREHDAKTKNDGVAVTRRAWRKTGSVARYCARSRRRALCG